MSAPHIAFAHPQECNNLKSPVTFVEATGVLCLDTIKLTDSSDSQIYRAALKSLAPEKPNSFELISAEPDNHAVDINSPTFNPISGVLSLPRVDIPKIFGTERYSANLTFKPDTNSFELNTADIFFNSNYKPNETWKPYGSLDSEERRAVDLLGRSVPYAKLANAVYDFNSAIDNPWQLVEIHEKDSGMQAGLYYNKNSNELVLAFRGTEFCKGFSCSFSERKESFLDLKADGLLAIGQVDKQFNDAFNYAQDVVNRSEGRKITVTGHSLGGSLAQSIGASLGLETFAFNSAPVPKKFFEKHPRRLTDQQLYDSIFVLTDIHDPISNTDEAAGKIYFGSAHITPLIQFDFNKREIRPDRLPKLDSLRFNKHGMEPFIEHTLALLAVYRDGW